MIIGIMGAMPDEVDQLCARLENVTRETYAGVEYHCGTLQGKQVVVCCAGMGKANAASTVQVLCTKYGIDKLIFSGIADVYKRQLQACSGMRGSLVLTTMMENLFASL